MRAYKDPELIIVITLFSLTLLLTIFLGVCSIIDYNSEKEELSKHKCTLISKEFTGNTRRNIKPPSVRYEVINRYSCELGTKNRIIIRFEDKLR